MDKEPEITVRQENSGGQEILRIEGNGEAIHNNSVGKPAQWRTDNCKQWLYWCNFCSPSIEKTLLFWYLPRCVLSEPILRMKRIHRRPRDRTHINNWPKGMDCLWEIMQSENIRRLEMQETCFTFQKDWRVNFIKGRGTSSWSWHLTKL